MRKGRIAGVVTLAVGLLLVGSSAMASHTVTLSFSSNPATAGDEVTISVGTDSATAPPLELYICQVAGLPSPSAACAAGEAGIWVLLAATDGPGFTLLAHPYDTTGLGGLEIGFRGHQNPGPNSQHLNPDPIGDLVIQLPANGRHMGCNGIENAITKVKEGGNAKAKLTQIADKFDCDV